jgi:hypothetical protein
MTDPGVSRRTWGLLAAGHVVLMAGAAALAAAAAVHVASAGPPAGGEFRSGLGGPLGTAMFHAGLVALAAGQAMSLRELWPMAREIRGGRLTPGRLVRVAHRSEWSMALTLFPAVVCLLLIIDAPPPPILAPLAALLLGAPLLDQVHAIWTHRRIGAAVPPTGEPRPEHQVLPSGSGVRIRRRQGGAAVILGVFAGFGALLLVATVVTEAGRFPDAPAAATAHIAAATAAVLIPVLYIPPVRSVRGAVDGDAVHLPTLAHAARGLARATALTAALAVPVLAATLLTPAVAHLAAARPAMLAVAIGLAGSPQFASLTYLHFGAPQPSDLRRARRDGRR